MNHGAECGIFPIFAYTGDKTKMDCSRLMSIGDGEYIREVSLPNSTVTYTYKQVFHKCTGRILLESHRKREFHKNIRENVFMQPRSRGRSSEKLYERRIFDMIPQF